MGNPESSNEELQPISDIDPLIHAPTRLKIMAYLSIVESADFTFLPHAADRFNPWKSISEPAQTRGSRLCQHHQGICRSHPRTLIRLTADGHQAIRAYRDNMQTVLDDLLKQ